MGRIQPTLIWGWTNPFTGSSSTMDFPIKLEVEKNKTERHEPHQPCWFTLKSFGRSSLNINRWAGGMCGNVWETHTPNLAHFEPTRKSTPTRVCSISAIGFPQHKKILDLSRLWTKWSYNPKNQQGSSFLWRGECTCNYSRRWSAHSRWRHFWAGFGFLRQHWWYGKTPATLRKDETSVATVSDFGMF